jgi:Transcriptional regulator, AbiEi antitoxin N-terminal domain
MSTAVLAKHGVSAFRASKLARSGWLTHLGRGAYMLPGDTLTRDGSLAFLSEGVDEMIYVASLVARIRASASQTQASGAQVDRSW